MTILFSRGFYGKYKKVLTAILSAIFGFLVAAYTKDTFLGLIILTTTFLTKSLFKKIISKKQEKQE